MWEYKVNLILLVGKYAVKWLLVFLAKKPMLSFNQKTILPTLIHFDRNNLYNTFLLYKPFCIEYENRTTILF